MTIKPPNARFAEILAALRAKKAVSSPPPPTPVQETEIILTPSPQSSHAHTLDKYGNPITLNDKQLQVVELALQGKSFVLIGAAGTGKTTAQRAVVQALELAGKLGILSAAGHKHLTSGSPGALICAYTRRAVANIRRNVPSNMQGNCITCHKALEYQPIYYEVEDPESGKTRTTMRFEATRNSVNPLPSSILLVIFEEASMLGVDLHKEMADASPQRPQIIYLGDIQQLPPVFGPAILGFKLLELPVIELTEVYRQALESPIIKLAHRVLSGVPIPASEFPEWKVPGQLTIRPWKKRIDELNALISLSQAVFIPLEEAGAYNPDEDIILMPFNKGCGTLELNKKIANHLARKRCADVYQIVAGFVRVHYAVGDKVLVDKEDAIILNIEINPAYAGLPPQPHSPTLDYWGFDSAEHAGKTTAEMSDDAVDFMLAQVALAEDKTERVKSASHLITVQMQDSDQQITLSTAGDINAMRLGYCLTVHKAQGSEWRKVFLCIHQSHNIMVSRELLYTAITRAREELYIICEPDTFVKGIQSQRVKGNTLEEKAEYFKGKLNGKDTM